MKTIYSISLMVLMLAAMAFLAFSVPAHASDMDDRIESSAKESYERDLATKLAGDVNGVEDVNNKMTIE